MHYSLRTEQICFWWVRWFIRFHRLRHPRKLGRPQMRHLEGFTPRVNDVDFDSFSRRPAPGGPGVKREAIAWR